MNLFRFALLVGLGGFACLPPTASGIDLTAHFWLSNTLDGPDAPTLQSITGDVRKLALWGRPSTGENLHGFALNLVATPEDAFELQELLVVNPALPTPNTQRFQTTFDSSDGLPIYPEGTYGFNGFTVLNDVEGFPNGAGIGPECYGDPACFGTGSDTTWLMGILTFESGQAGTTSDLFLEISKLGVLHAGGTVEATLVTFGTLEGMPDTYDLAQAYVPPHGSTGPAGYRDAQIGATSQAAAGQTEWMAAGGGLSQWHNGARWSGGIPTSFDTAVIDVVQATPIAVSAAAVARQTDVLGGRLHLEQAAALDSPVDVSDGGAISGSGWVMGDLTLNALGSGGSLVVAQEEPLHVLGVAWVDGAELQFDDAFRPERGTSQVAVLRAFSGIDGTLDAPLGQLATGLQLNQIWHNPYDITIELYYESADFDEDGDVDGHDLLLLQNGWGGSEVGDANGDHLVDDADMAVWHAQFSASKGAVASLTIVPEPCTLVGAWFLFGVPFCAFNNARRRVKVEAKSTANYALSDSLESCRDGSVTTP